jgi:putative membrane protein
MRKRRREAVKENRVNHMKLLLRWICTSITIFVAVKLLPGIRFEGPWRQLGIVALISGLLNALVRPVLMFLTCPLILLTLGLFILIIGSSRLGRSPLGGEHLDMGETEPLARGAAQT